MSADSVENTNSFTSEEVIDNNDNEEVVSGSDNEENGSKEKDISPERDGKLLKQVIREGKGL